MRMRQYDPDGLDSSLAHKSTTVSQSKSRMVKRRRLAEIQLLRMSMAASGNKLWNLAVASRCSLTGVP